MNKEVFNKLIENPAKVDPKYKGALRQLVETFPYSANIRLLYLSSLLNDADVLFEQELKKTAAYITDRRILKKLIEPVTTSKDEYIIDEAPMEVVKVEPKAESQKPVDEDKEVTDASVTGSISDSSSSKPRLHSMTETLIELEKEEETEETESNSTSTPLSVTAPIQEKEEEETSTQIQTPDKEEETPQKVDELDELIISSAVSASLSMEIDEVAEEIKSEQKEESENSTEKPLTVNRQQNDEPKSFLEWIGGTEVESVKPKLDPKEQERVEFRKRAESLIDQFIQNQPKIRPKTEFYSPENMAQKSVEDSEEIVTETLAKVYAAQGNIAKAKSIYEQLILNNPEKKSYFASLLEKLGKE